MKKLLTLFAIFTLTTAGALWSAEAAGAPMVRYVSFKECLEKSKLGKEEQDSFEAMKKKMESSLSEKEKELNDMAAKLNDPDYLDSITPEAETELKRKFRNLNQELSQVQNQFYQALQQTNMKVVQKMQEAVAAASKEVALAQKIDLVLNEETCFYRSPALDITADVVKAMDKNYTPKK